MGWVQVESTPWMNFGGQQTPPPPEQEHTDQSKKQVEKEERYEEKRNRQRHHDLQEKMRSGVRMPRFLPWWDTQQTANETEHHRKAYREMLSDSTVKAALLTKILAVSGQDLKVMPASPSKRDHQIAEFVEWSYNEGLEGGIPELSWSILSGSAIDGFSICEKVWEKETEGQYKNKLILRKLKPKDVNQDLYLLADEFGNVTGMEGLRFNAGLKFRMDDFVHHKNLGLYGNPFGMSDLRAVYKDYWMLDTVTKLRAIGAEKRAFPIAVGKYEDATQQDNLEYALANLKSNNWIAVPKEIEIQVLNMAGSAESYFKQFRDDCLESIFLGITGATLQSITSRSGAARGASTIHKDTADILKWQLTSSLQHTMNNRKVGITRDMVVKNFSSVDRLPKVILSGVDDGELAESVTIDRALSDMGNTQGWKLTKKQVEEKYGRKLIDAPQGGMPGMPGMPGAGPQGGGGLEGLFGGGGVNQGEEQEPSQDDDGDGVPDYDDGATFEQILNDVLKSKS